jgi:Tfp pilus assembly protein PilF
MERVKRIDALLSMLQTEPTDVFLNYSLAIEYLSETNFGLAEGQFLKVLNFQPDYIPVFYQLGKLYEQQNKSEKALEFYKRGLEFAKAQKNNKAVNEFGEAIFMLEE